MEAVVLIAVAVLVLGTFALGIFVGAKTTEGDN